MYTPIINCFSRIFSPTPCPVKQASSKTLSTQTLLNNGYSIMPHIQRYICNYPLAKNVSHLIISCSEVRTLGYVCMYLVHYPKPPTPPPPPKRRKCHNPSKSSMYEYHMYIIFVLAIQNRKITSFSYDNPARNE